MHLELERLMTQHRNSTFPVYVSVKSELENMPKRGNPNDQWGGVLYL